MKSNRHITYDSTYNGKRILTDKERGLGCDTSILEKTDKLINHYTDKHNKVLCVRFDLGYPKEHIVPTDNKDFSKFTSTFNKNLKRNGLDPMYIAVREQSREKHQHYHVALLCDGNKVQHPHKIIKTAEKHWNAALNVEDKSNGLVDHCTRSRSGEKQVNSYRLRRNDADFEQVLNDSFERCSYLAKASTKGNAPSRTREVFSSRIPKG